MKIEFMVEDHQHFNSDLEYKIVESYYPNEYPYRGYDIYRVETDDIRNIRVCDTNSMIEYMPEQTIQCKDGNETIYYVSIWTPIA